MKGWQNKVEVAIRKYTVVVDAHLTNNNISIDANLTLFWQAKTLFYIKSILIDYCFKKTSSLIV